MISNEERHDVAARLRNYENLRESFRESPICAFLDALGVEYLDWKGVCSRLADLIEPEPERTCKLRESFTEPMTLEHMQEYECSECGGLTNAQVFDNSDILRYCPNCGAKAVEE